MPFFGESTISLQKLISFEDEVIGLKRWVPRSLLEFTEVEEELARLLQCEIIWLLLVEVPGPRSKKWTESISSRTRGTSLLTSKVGRQESSRR
jgi:hypothetical protein